MLSTRAYGCQLIMTLILGIVLAGMTFPAPDARSSVAETGCTPTLQARRTPDTQAHEFVNEGVPTLPDAALPSVGTLRTIMVFVDFSDHPQTESTQGLYDRLAPSAIDFYEDASYGRFHLQIDMDPNWYRMPKPFSQYFTDPDSSRLPAEEQREFINDAMTKADANVDFSQYKGVYVVASKDSLGGVFVLPPVHVGTGIVKDGTEIRAWMGIGSVAYYETVPGVGAKNSTWHDTGHWLGLPDVYHRTQDDETDWNAAGAWDIMSDLVKGAHFFAWHAYKLGWIDPTQLRCINGAGEMTVDLTPASVIGGVKALVIKIRPSIAYVVEARDRNGRDSEMCDEGVLVYKVDASVLNAQGVLVVQAAQPDDSARIGYYDCAPKYNAGFDLGPGEVSVFENTTDGLKIEVLAKGSSGYTVRGTYTPPPPPPPHSRSVNFFLSEHLVASGQVIGSFPPGICVSFARVKIQRKTASGWKTVGLTESGNNNGGLFSKPIPDKPGRYRARLPLGEDYGEGCAAATSPVVRHSHTTQ